MLKENMNKMNASKLQIMLKENMNKMNATVEGNECNENVKLN